MSLAHLPRILRSLAPIGSRACSFGPRVLKELVLHDNPEREVKLTSKIGYVKSIEAPSKSPILAFFHDISNPHVLHLSSDALTALENLIPEIREQIAQASPSDSIKKSARNSNLLRETIRICPRKTTGEVLKAEVYHFKNNIYIELKVYARRKVIPGLSRTDNCVTLDFEGLECLVRSTGEIRHYIQELKKSGTDGFVFERDAINFRAMHGKADDCPISYRECHLPRQAPLFQLELRICNGPPSERRLWVRIERVGDAIKLFISSLRHEHRTQNFSHLYAMMLHVEEFEALVMLTQNIREAAKRILDKAPLGK